MKYVASLLIILSLTVSALFLFADPPQPNVESVTLNYTDGSTQTFAAAPPAIQPNNLPPNVANPKKTLGVNLEGIADWDRSFMFIDAMRTARKFGAANVPHGENAPLDANGWPTTDAGTLVMTEVKNINGTYRFFAQGQCEITAIPAQVRNYAYDERSNRSTAEIVVNQPPDKEVTLILIFKNTFGGLKNIKLLRPGYDSDVDIFTKEFKRAIAPFGAIRFMDYLDTNDSLIRTWDERVKPTDATYTVKGGPYEFAIELGNRTGKDIWLCVPALADDDHVRKLGELVRAKLRPDLNCFIEYSNEVWNGQFKQYHQNFELAKQEAKTDRSLVGAMNDFYRAWWRVAKRSVEIKKLLGDDPRFKVVLASQVGYSPPGYLIKEQLEYIERNHGHPRNFIYAVACAPYFSPGKDPDDPKGEKWYTQRENLTVDMICDRLLEKTNSAAGDHVKAFHKLAAKYGLKSFAYEGGLDLQQYPVSLDAKLQSNFDPRIGRALEEYLNKWYDSGGDSFFYFNLNCRYTKYGYWGLTDDSRNVATYKYQAAARVAERLK